MFTFYNTTIEYYKLDEDELQNLYNDYKEYCNENGLDFTDEINFSDFDPIKWINEMIPAYKIEQDDCNEYDLFVEMIKVNSKQEIRNKITELKAQIRKLENML